MKLVFTLSILLVLVGKAHAASTCTVEGNTYQLHDSFPHPKNNCSVCECCGDGYYTCVIKECPAIDCGRLKLQNSSDGCCLECKPECNDANCPTLDCPSRIAYPPDSCCGVCGCNLTDTDWPMEVVANGTFGSCDRCTCHENGTYSCTDATCPSRLLECVNPIATKNGTNCTFTCPEEYTCRRSKHLLKEFRFTKIGFNSCTCMPNQWFPRGGCIQTKWPNPAAQIPLNHLCMSNMTVDDLQHDSEFLIHWTEFF